MTAKQKIKKLEKVSFSIADAIHQGAMPYAIWEQASRLMGNCNREISRLKQEGRK